jgi:predicted dehydrogenase
LIRAYRLLCGLGSHDLSAMRELLGFPHGVVSATQWNGGTFMVIVFAYDGFRAILETGVDDQRRFDAHIEIYGNTRSLRIQYDTPYLRHLPTTLVIRETVGEAFTERIIRPTFADPYTRELEAFHEVVTHGAAVKTTPEDFRDDLRLFGLIVERLREDLAAT